MFEAEKMALSCEYLEYIYEMPFRGFTKDHREVRGRLIAQSARAFTNAIYI